MADGKIKALLEMIEPSTDPFYKGGTVSYETAKEWADELIELRASKDVITFDDGEILAKDLLISILDERVQILEFINEMQMVDKLWKWMEEKGYK